MTDAAQAALELNAAVTDYMIGAVDGGAVARAQQEFLSARLWERSLGYGRQGVSVTWNDDGVAVVCQRRSCMVHRDGHTSWWQEQMGGAYLPIDQVAAAVDAHAAVHRGEPWDG